MKRTLLATLLGTLLLSACGGGKDTGLLDRPNDTPPPEPTLPRLSAYSLTAQMHVNTTKNIDISAGVVANDVASWALTQVVDNHAMGSADNVQSTNFDYTALTTGIAVLDYTVEGEGETAQASVLVAVNDDSSSAPSSNTPPLAQNVTDETLSNSMLSIDLTAYVSDIDGDSLSIEHVISPSTRFSDNGKGEVSYTPNGFVGIDTAAYSVSDGRGGFDVAYVLVNSIDANPSTPNTPPTASDILVSFNADEMAHWTVDLATHNSGNTIFDADGDALSIERILAGNGRVSFTGTSLTYTPEADFSGIDEFSYVISDGKGGYGIATVTLVVNRTTASNTIPSAKPVTVNGVMDNEPAVVLIDVSPQVNDADGDSLRLALLSGSNGRARISISDPLSIEYRVPSPAQGLQDTFTYVVSDGKGGHAMSTVRVDMLSHNPSAPTTTLGVYNTTQDAVLSIDLSKYIHDNETPTSDLLISDLTIENAPAGHVPSISLNGHMLTYTPKGFVGFDVLSYSVLDGELSASGRVVILSSDNRADAAILNANDISVVIDVASQGMVAQHIDWLSEVSSDRADAQFTLVSAPGAALGSTSVSNNVLSYTPTASDGVDKFVYVVKDDSTPAQYAQGLVTVFLDKPPAPQITVLSASLENAELSAFVDCDTCDGARYRYQWSVNGLNVGSDATLPYRGEFDGFNIRLEVIGEDAFGQKTQTEYVLYEKHGVQTLYATDTAFSALKTDGSVVAWGQSSSGGNISTAVNAELVDVEQIFSNQSAFVALTQNNGAIAWGLAESGGSIPADVATQLTDIKTIVGTSRAFAALKNDGTVVTWGTANMGGDSSALASQLVGVDSIAANNEAFAALKNDGTVVTWGIGGNGGKVPDATALQLVNVKEIVNTNRAFAALKYDGSVVAWGNASEGGTIYAATAQKLVGVKKIYSSDAAFVALKHNGEVVAWGIPEYGASIPANTIAELVNIKEIISSSKAFAALKRDGSVVAWGDALAGGSIPTETAPLLENITSIYRTDFAFAAYKADGTLITWGDAAQGGLLPTKAVSMLGGVKSVSGASRAFAALKTDASVIAWGHTSYGGTIPTAKQPLLKPTLVEIESSL